MSSSNLVWRHECAREAERRTKLDLQVDAPICGLSILTQWFRGNRRTDAPPFFPRGRGGRLLACTSGSLVAHRVATDVLGFGFASLLLMIYQMRLLGHHRWWTTLVLSSLFIALVSYTFRVWLYMPLPRGLMGF